MSLKNLITISIVLVEPASERILVCVRGSQASFMPGALVFPGGLVESADEKFPLDRLSNLRSHRNVTSDQLSTRVCGARELFEVLLPYCRLFFGTVFVFASRNVAFYHWIRKESKSRDDPNGYRLRKIPALPIGRAKFSLIRWRFISFTDRLVILIVFLNIDFDLP